MGVTETARIHHASRRRGDMAAYCAGTAPVTPVIEFLDSASLDLYAIRLRAFRQGLGT
jgi:hypothetical protein